MSGLLITSRAKSLFFAVVASIIPALYSSGIASFFTISRAKSILSARVALIMNPGSLIFLFCTNSLANSIFASVVLDKMYCFSLDANSLFFNNSLARDTFTGLTTPTVATFSLNGISAPFNTSL